MVHSQGGNFGFNAGLAAPDKVKAIVAIEPTGAPKPGPELEQLKNIPILIVWGDFVEKHGIWRKYAVNVKVFADDLQARGGKVEWVELPREAFRGTLIC